MSIRFYDLPDDVQDVLTQTYSTREMCDMGLHPADHDEYGTPEHERLVERGHRIAMDTIKNGDRYEQD